MSQPRHVLMEEPFFNPDVIMPRRNVSRREHYEAMFSHNSSENDSNAKCKQFQFELNIQKLNASYPSSICETLQTKHT